MNKSRTKSNASIVISQTNSQTALSHLLEKLKHFTVFNSFYNVSLFQASFTGIIFNVYGTIYFGNEKVALLLKVKCVKKKLYEGRKTTISNFD